MTKKIIYSFLIILVTIAVQGYFMRAGAEDIMDIVKKVHSLMSAKKAKGEDITRAEELDRKSKDAAKGGRRDEAERLLREALSLLEGGNHRAPEPSYLREEQKPLASYSRINTSIDYNIDSYFGIHSPSIVDRPLPANGRQPVMEFDRAEDLASAGAGWVRYDRLFVWDAIEQTKGSYDWTRPDFVIGETYKNGVNILAVVNPMSKLYGGKIGYAPTDTGAYLKFLQAAVERYSGRGAIGAPRVDYWQICNEIDNAIYWHESPETYARLLVESYKVIKRANPAAKVLLGSMATPAGLNYHMQVIKALPKNEPAFDIFDFHWFSAGDDGYRKHSLEGVTFDNFVADIKSVLRENGYGAVPLWIGEAGDYSGSPDGGSRIVFKEHTEKEQAASLVKIYLHSIANDVKKIFWVSLTEWYGFGNIKNGYFDHVGLVHNNKHNAGSGKKAAYYAYHAMSDIFSGARFEKAVEAGNGSYIYRFVKNGKPVWALWNDSVMSSASVELPSNVSGVKLIDAINGDVIAQIPARGQDVTSGRLRRSMNVVSVDLGKMPVYIVTE